MEDLDLVKTIHEASPSSVESDVRSTHHSVGCNLNNSRSSPLLSTNGVSSFSGKTSVIQGAVEVLTSFMQDLQNSGRTDSEIWRNCEIRWLQLFSLVEKQCQEQIAAQQQQFNSQIQRIQEEINNLVKLQINSSLWNPCNENSPNKLANAFSTLESQMVLCSEICEGNEHTISQPKIKPKTSASHQDCTVDSISMSSGYGTFCAAELNPNPPKNTKEFMERKEVSKGQDEAAVASKDPSKDNIKNQSVCIQTIEEFGSSLKEDISVCPNELEHSVADEAKNFEEQLGKTNSSKSLTSWAQKLKQNQPKKAHVEEGGSYSTQGNEQAKKATIENPDITADTHPPAFYLSKRDESPNSLMSEASGLTYWKLEEKELYHSLPETSENTLSSIFPSNVFPNQSSSGIEVKLPSLKEIYHKKQKENKQLPEWNLSSASHLSHPPEVLTLDPTLHMKPSQQNPGIPSQSLLSTLDDRISFSPDSVLEPSMSSHSESDTFSQASNITSSQLGGSPKYPSSIQASRMDSWKNHAFQNERNTSPTFPLAYTLAGNDLLINPEDEENTLMLTPSSAIQSPFPSADNSLPEGSVSVASFDDPVMLSKIRQNLRKKHERHIADLRAYYDAEIHNLKQQLEANNVASASEDLKKTNQNLIDRCDQLESALNEANTYVRTLENKNNLLEMEAADWRERFNAVSSASKVLQERVEEMRISNKEKDNSISRLKSRLKDLEEAFEKAYKLADDKDARIKQENRVFQNQTTVGQSPHKIPPPLPSLSQLIPNTSFINPAAASSTHLLGEYESLGREHERVKDTLSATENKLFDAHTQISDLKRTISKLEVQIKQVEHESMSKLRNTRGHLRTSNFKYHSPPEKDFSCEGDRTTLMAEKEKETLDTPIMKALKEFDEGKAFKNWGTQTEKEDQSIKALSSRHSVGFAESPFSSTRSPEKGKDQQRPKRFTSSAAHRSSSLPPSNRKPNTPTKREIMLSPVTATYSPKRSPKENLSPGFSHLLSQNESSVSRFDVLLDDLDSVPVSTIQQSSPRKRLQFLSFNDVEENKLSNKDNQVKHSFCAGPFSSGMKRGSVGSAWEETTSVPNDECTSLSVTPYGDDFEYTARIRTLAETERLFDELIQEKQQIEAALSRMPCTGGRMTLQTRLNQEALEDRLEKINRELGSIRMTLKKFHVLRTSANL
ncbi:M-phase phosphoprotein 9 isoform X2 [Tachyglossus aculeatus]|uniref:M-phase phosphoprotein 9 isoform X2 n=1 Tax=Tachyglossus aculeatus TaxID=9261 RepID=UPI0018F38BAE|nr:M-phase phosphoprotein 9 isoform X2 [Tachyglossus aculeatus]